MSCWWCFAHHTRADTSWLHLELKGQDFALGEWYSCRGLALIANSEYQLWGLRSAFHLVIRQDKILVVVLDLNPVALWWKLSFRERLLTSSGGIYSSQQKHTNSSFQLILSTDFFPLRMWQFIVLASVMLTLTLIWFSIDLNVTTYFSGDRVF